jgi:hypothetical protein
MTQTNDTCRGARPSGVRRPEASRTATRATRARVSSDAVISAYIRDIARPHTDRRQHDAHPAIILEGHGRAPLQRPVEAHA